MNKQIIQDIIDWIETDLARDMTLDSVAKRAGYSKWHFQRGFSEFTGYTLATYIRQRRLTELANALRNTDDQIESIIHRYGFSSRQCACRMFLKQFGMTMSQVCRGKLPRDECLLEKLELRHEF